MNKLLWTCAALLTVFVTVDCLTCETCDASILGYCLRDTHVNCTSSENRCYSAVAKFTPDFLDIYERGCIAQANCKNDSSSILYVNYTITRTCCSTNLCNGAAPVQLPLTAALSAALVAVWSHWSL